MDKGEQHNTSLAAWCWLLLSATVTVIVALYHFPDGADWKWCIPLTGRFHLPMMLGGTVTVALLSLLVFRCCNTGPLRRGRLLAVSLALMAMQTVLVYSYYVHTDWDVQQLTGAARAMAEGRPTQEFQWYFQWNPNNLLLTRLFAAIFFVTGPLWGLKTALFPLLMLQSAGAAITALMLVQTAMHIWHRKDCALLAYILYLLLVWLSPWWSIPYSDVWGLMLSVLMLWMATAAPFKREWVRIFTIAAVCALGYYIKPQTLFVALSIVLVRLAATLRRRRGMKPLLRPAAIALGGIATGVLAAHLAVAGCGMHLHTSKGQGVSHFLMLGANYQSIGIYSEQDVAFARSFPKKKERRNAELAETAKRYSHLGIGGTLTLWKRKNLLNFSDGTFYWGREGDFYSYVPERSGWLARLTRNTFYNRSQQGPWYEGWAAGATTLWFGILVFAMLAALPKRKAKKEERKAESKAVTTTGNGQTMDIIFWALLMLTLFHTLCEARARYLFCFLPLFVLAAVGGIRRIKTKLDEK